MTPLVKKTIFILCLFLPITWLNPAHGKERRPFTVVVESPYIYIRTGAGKAYPVFYIAQRGQLLTVHRSKTAWYQVKLEVNSHRTITGWVHREDLRNALVYGSTQLASEHRRLKSDFDPNWNGSFAIGRLEDADRLSISFAYQHLKSLSYELRGSVFNGVREEGWLINGQLVYSPFYRWRVAPYVTAGYGYVKRDTSGTAINQSDVSDQYLLAGAGFNIRISQRYDLRLEYQQLNVLTEIDDNRELDSWLVGLSAEF